MPQNGIKLSGTETCQLLRPSGRSLESWQPFLRHILLHFYWINTGTSRSGDIDEEEFNHL